MANFAVRLVHGPAGEDEIRTRLARDPWASAGLLRVGPIEPWALWLDGRG